MNAAAWNLGLIHGGLLLLIGTVAIIQCPKPRQRLLALGIVAQALALISVTGGLRIPRPQSEFPALLGLAVFLLWMLQMQPGRARRGTEETLSRDSADSQARIPPGDTP